MEKEEAERTEQNECNDNDNFLQPKPNKKKEKSKNKRQETKKQKKINIINLLGLSHSFFPSFLPVSLSICLSFTKTSQGTYLPDLPR